MHKNNKFYFSIQALFFLSVEYPDILYKFKVLVAAILPLGKESSMTCLLWSFFCPGWLDQAVPQFFHPRRAPTRPYHVVIFFGLTSDT